MSARLGCFLALELALASSLCSDTLARCTLGYNLSSHQLLVWFRIVFFGGKKGNWGKRIFTGFVEVEGVIGFPVTGSASFFLRW